MLLLSFIRRKVLKRLINDSEQPPLYRYHSVMYERLCLDLETVKTISGGNSFQFINVSGGLSFQIPVQQIMEDFVKPYCYIIIEKRKYSE